MINHQRSSLVAARKRHTPGIFSAVVLPLIILLSAIVFSAPAVAEDGEPKKNYLGIPALIYQANDSGGEYSISIQILTIMTLLTVLPSLLIMMTSFTRIIVVMAILRQALGLQQTPSNQIILGLALFLTLFIMMPVFRVINAEAVQPYMAETITPLEAAERALKPIHEFMLSQTRENDLNLFVRISGEQNIASPEETPIHILIPAFITSELKTAFQIGFLIFIPFLIIDLVVASILMAMGMMMLSPIIISLPFKIMLFVLIDGWALIMGTLANSFGTV
ncbi:flagellar type III secretion system pore protein FliP [Bacterioplanoides sp.]|uniref:flagellar type III secretion system pore protein FliP n=1 Tax=Bacterioplanoides sp. TaxID=2066072 RepID=UPI003B00D88D